MGLMDKFKEAAKKATDVGKGLLDAGAEAVNQAIEENKKKQEEAAAEYARKKEEEAQAAAVAAAAAEEEDNLRREQRFAEMLAPSCDKGDCIFFGQTLCCTCPEDCECERKTYARCQYVTEYPELWKYYKLLKQHGKFEEVKKEGDLYPSTEKDDQYFYQMFRDEFLPNYTGSDAVNVGAWFINSVLPMWMYDDFYKFAFGVIRAANSWTDIEDLSAKLDSMFTMSNIYRRKDAFAENPIFCTHTLFNRDIPDFRKTVFCLMSVENINKLMDDNFDIYPYGEGGPSKGFYGPCIFNIMNKYQMYNITKYLSTQKWYNERFAPTPDPIDMSKYDREILRDDDEDFDEEDD